MLVLLSLFGVKEKEAQKDCKGVAVTSAKLF